jgi:hypothetical protein
MDLINLNGSQERVKFPWPGSKGSKDTLHNQGPQDSQKPGVRSPGNSKNDLVRIDIRLARLYCPKS